MGSEHTGFSRRPAAEPEDQLEALRKRLSQTVTQVTTVSTTMSFCR